MNQQELIACIENPGLVKPEYLNDLEDLEKKYPNFQAIKVLKLKILKDSNDLSFTDYLKTVAIEVPNRYQLYKVLLREQVEQQIEQVISTPEEVVVQANETPETKETTPPAVSEEKSIEDVLATIKKLQEESKKTEVIPDKPEITIEPENQEVNTQKTETSTVEESISAPEQPLETKPDISQLTDAVLDELIKPGSHTLYQIEKVFGLTEKENERDPLEDQPKESTSQKPPKRAGSEKKTKSQPTSFLDWLEPIEPESKAPSPNEIIDKFIQDKPRISKFDKDKSVSENLFKIVDKDDIVTETLARIYIKQKNYKKAAEIYQKLSLNIPEKKGYFASQIHFLEELIKKD